MRTEQINIYKFDELSAEAKKAALQKYSDINVDHDWWQFIYEDNAQIGAEIKGFDLNNGGIDCRLTDTPYNICDRIKANHGKTTDTHKLAIEFQHQWDSLVKQFENPKKPGYVAEEKTEEFDIKADELEEHFKKDLSKIYLKLLKDDYEYLTSEEVIEESIISNEYEFYFNGHPYYKAPK